MKNVYVENLEEKMALWELEILHVDGRSLERKGRDDINEMLSEGWVILSVYTLRYKGSDDTWLERPMAILGYPRHPVKSKLKKEKKHMVRQSIVL